MAKKGGRQCVHWSKLKEAHGGRVSRGDVVDADLRCGRKERQLVRMGGFGNTNQKYGKGGCRYGCVHSWIYTYKNKAGKMRTGCYRGDPKLRISSLKAIGVTNHDIPVYVGKKAGSAQDRFRGYGVWQVFNGEGRVWGQGGFW